MTTRKIYASSWRCAPVVAALRAEGHEVYRLAAQRLHTDAGGTIEAFQQLQQARAVLGL